MSLLDPQKDGSSVERLSWGAKQAAVESPTEVDWTNGISHSFRFRMIELNSILVLVLNSILVSVLYSVKSVTTSQVIKDHVISIQ